MKFYKPFSPFRFDAVPTISTAEFAPSSQPGRPLIRTNVSAVKRRLLQETEEPIAIASYPPLVHIEGELGSNAEQPSVPVSKEDNRSLSLDKG